MQLLLRFHKAGLLVGEPQHKIGSMFSGEQIPTAEVITVCTVFHESKLILYVFYVKPTDLGKNSVAVWFWVSLLTNTWISYS